MISLKSVLLVIRKLTDGYEILEKETTANLEKSISSYFSNLKGSNPSSSNFWLKT